MARLWRTLTILCLVALQYCRGTGASFDLEGRAPTAALAGAEGDGQDSNIVLRREINDFLRLNDGKTANLFLLALRQLYSKDKGDLMSFWEVAGIHGRPHRSWNNEGQTGSGGGWAPHSSTLFLTWHRAFLGLFEQVIYQNAQQILDAATMEFQNGYRQALHDLRLPYFDWASNGGRMPDILTLPKWNVVLPDTVMQLIDNPLYQSTLQNGTFNDDECFPHAPQNTWNRSVRSPSSHEPDAVSELSHIQEHLAANTTGLQRRIKALLLDDKYSTWPAFSNEGSTEATYQSIEALHNDFHQLIGGPNTGHMTYYDYAAFDPIFYLSHANLDRLCAIWQIMHPDAWVTPQINQKGNFGTLANDTESTGTPLKPFRDSNGKFWTSNDVRNIMALGYSYPELQLKPHSNGATGFRDHVRGQVEGLYGSASSAPEMTFAPVV